jgi:hypothetical protein
MVIITITSIFEEIRYFVDVVLFLANMVMIILNLYEDGRVCLPPFIKTENKYFETHNLANIEN